MNLTEHRERKKEKAAAILVFILLRSIFLLINLDFMLLIFISDAVQRARWIVNVIWVRNYIRMHQAGGKSGRPKNSYTAEALESIKQDLTRFQVQKDNGIQVKLLFL